MNDRKCLDKIISYVRSKELNETSERQRWTTNMAMLKRHEYSRSDVKRKNVNKHKIVDFCGWIDHHLEFFEIGYKRS